MAITLTNKKEMGHVESVSGSLTLSADVQYTRSASRIDSFNGHIKESGSIAPSGQASFSYSENSVNAPEGSINVYGDSTLFTSLQKMVSDAISQLKEDYMTDTTGSIEV